MVVALELAQAIRVGTTVKRPRRIGAEGLWIQQAHAFSLTHRLAVVELGHRALEERRKDDLRVGTADAGRVAETFERLLQVLGVGGADVEDR